MISLMRRFTILSLLFVQVLRSQNGQTTCAIPSVEENQSTYLTCYYTIDLLLLRTNFAVFYYVNEEQKPENVVDCIWRGTDPQPKCQVSRGFQTPELKGSEVRILLQKASSSNVGEYSCTAGDSFPPNSKRCLFSLLQPGSTTVAPSAHTLIIPIQDSTTDEGTDKSSGTSAPDSMSRVIEGIIVLLFTLSFIALIYF